MTPQHDIEELFNLIDQHTVSYTQLDEKFGNWHKYGVVDRESLLNDLAAYCQKREKALIQAIRHEVYGDKITADRIKQLTSEHIAELSNQQSIETKEK